MKEKISNLCWEFCYEFIPAKLDANGDPQILILNLPAALHAEVERRLLDYNFYCTRTINHGGAGMIMQFKKVGFAVEP